MTQTLPLLVGLPPIIDAGVEVLVLGSFPSPASLVGQQYYAHPQNQFWRVMGELIGEPQASRPYAARQEHLLRHHVGVWDVYRYCRREGALDSAIEEAERNDFSLLRCAAPRLRGVIFNGKEAARSARHLEAQGLVVSVAPSTSPAYTLAFARKLECWRTAWALAAT